MGQDINIVNNRQKNIKASLFEKLWKEKCRNNLAESFGVKNKRVKAKMI